MLNKAVMLLFPTTTTTTTNPPPPPFEQGAICEAPEIAGPGFINLRLTDEFVKAQVSAVV